MSFKTIGNNHVGAFGNGTFDKVNLTNSHQGDLFSSTAIPKGPHTLPAPGNNVQSAKGGGLINRKKINNLSRRYKMRSRRLSRKRRCHLRRWAKSNRYYCSSCKRRRSRSRRRRSYQQGGGGVPGPQVTPTYPGGHLQYNNNQVLPNSYATASTPLSASSSALANPVSYKLNVAGGNIDNYRHFGENAFGNTGAGSGFPSRGM